MIEVLAALSLSAAVGMRIALPLLLIGLLYSDSLWANVPLLSRIPPPLVLGVLVSWSLVELLFSKERLGQRLLQIVQLLFSPLVGAMVGLTVARTAGLESWLTWMLGVVGGLLAFVLHLVQVGWSYRLRGLPLWVIFIQDFLCVALVLLAFDAPRQGGLIVLLMLWIAIRSSTEWRRWYLQQAGSRSTSNPRRYKQDPD
ncbi:MAG: DUF4126 domain-containing protein [Synechococcales cyanobacterium C42_A2020_086]|jgi:hypothetical protein|nr:DUF4126 domain-containing protein [Synechococcales cyanobacterium M58_A2018_015]MBF2075200.1 DUF4126 domain-containing protein [Synechococcales cyanobacterium C42_A2020_086]